jgi:hypothetical protein
MGSISSVGGTLDLLRSDQAAAGVTTSSRPAIALTPPAPETKAVNTIPEMSKVEELKGKDPTQFQQVLTDAVTSLKAAAKQTADPLEAGFLWNLANRFQMALDTGNTLPLQESTPPGSTNPTSGPALA